MIDAAGGEDPLAAPGDRSREKSRDEVPATRPEIVGDMPCGLSAAAAEREAQRHRERLGALGAREVHAVDAASSFSRPGPRLADGVELLGHLLHPDLVEGPAELESRRVL
jgi:iron complex transport system substrate-binding protein